MASKRIHILFLCSRLDTPGGIERAVVNTASLFARNGYNVTLLVADTEGTNKSFYPLPATIKVIWTPLTFGISDAGNPISRKADLIKNIITLRSIFKKELPDFVIATEYQFSIAAVLTGIRKETKIISWEHHHFDWLKKNRFWSLLQKFCYPKLAFIVCLNCTESLHFEQYTKTVVIPNFIEEVHTRRTEPVIKQILTVGWLINRKGTDLLLNVALPVLKKNPDWRWKLVGDGELKPMVEEFILKHGLSEQLILQSPNTSDINAEYEQSSLYVLTSRFEAFPMVLLEAMSFGIPCISFDCPSGPSDIITNNQDGILVENGNTNNLISALERLINEDKTRKIMSVNAITNITRFSGELVFKKWKTLFDFMN